MTEENERDNDTEAPMRQSDRAMVLRMLIELTDAAAETYGTERALAGLQLTMWRACRCWPVACVPPEVVSRLNALVRLALGSDRLDDSTRLQAEVA